MGQQCGVFKNEEIIEKKSEKDIYKMLGMDFVPPELRESRGEIKAAKKGTLPELIELEDIKGDLQTHSKRSDGQDSILEMVETAKEIGHKYMSVTDHSAYVGVTKGLKDSDITKQIDSIAEVDEKFSDIKVLSGVEVDVLEDGKLDLSDEVLRKLDVVIFSIHSHFDLPEDKQTERILKAMDNPYVNIFAHPTGRMIGKRDPYRYDLEKVFEHAKESNVILEINAYPSRLDLNDINAKMAKDIGADLSISTDAHSTEELSYMKYGVWQASRGWVEKDDVVNALPLGKFKEKLKR